MQALHSLAKSIRTLGILMHTVNASNAIFIDVLPMQS